MRLRLVVPTSGRDVRTLAQAQSAVWAPDRRHAATLRDGRVMVASLEEVTPLGAGAPLGKIVVTNGRSVSPAREFWTVDARTQGADGLPTDLRAK